MSEQSKLPEGIRLFPKNEKQPEFVIASMVITLNDLYKFAKENPDLLTEYNGAKQLKLQILKSQAGGIYAKVDNWKPAVQAAPVTTPEVAPEIEDINELPW